MLYRENRDAETIAACVSPDGGELTGLAAIPILCHFPAPMAVADSAAP
jgi:hypothetical protein